MRGTVVWSADGVLVIGIAAVLPRAEARLRIRAATCAAAARWLKLGIDAVALESTPGAPPRLLLAGRAAGLSFSHDEGLSLAAIRLQGAIGIDVMRVQDIADWEQVARDYLGPRVAEELGACPADLRALRLAQAWTAREAALKYAGRQLAEWDDVAPACRLQALSLPAPHVATLAY